MITSKKQYNCIQYWCSSQCTLHTQRSSFSIGLDSEAGGMAYHTSAQARAVGTDLRLLERTDLDLEGALDDVLSAVCHVDNVIAGFGGAIDAGERVQIQAVDGHWLLETLWTENLDKEIAFSRALGVHLEVRIVSHADALGLHSTTSGVALPGVHRCTQQ